MTTHELTTRLAAEIRRCLALGKTEADLRASFGDLADCLDEVAKKSMRPSVLKQCLSPGDER